MAAPPSCMTWKVCGLLIGMGAEHLASLPKSLAHSYVMMGGSTSWDENDSVAIGGTSGLTWEPLSRARQAVTDGAEGSEQQTLSPRDSAPNPPTRCPNMPP